MCSYSAFLLSYAPFFCGVKIVFFPLFITVSRYYDMYAQGGVTCMRRAVLHVCAGRCYIYALYERLKAFPFQKELSVRTRLGDVPRPASPFWKPLFSVWQSMLIHAIKMKIYLLYAYSSVWLTLACLITPSDTIITPLELLVKKFLLTFWYILSMICL